LDDANWSTFLSPILELFPIRNEYYFPLLDKIHDSAQCEIIRLKLRNFYSAVKGSCKYLKFTFITGITKFKQVSLFSSLNNVIDITFNRKFHAICGFTKNEIIKYYKPNLKKTIPKVISSGHLQHKATVKMIMNAILDWYDGYRWDNKKSF
jgi:hypothetical protein